MIDIISIHAPYAGGDDLVRGFALVGLYISIHAPYAGGDLYCWGWKAGRGDISIHAPYAGGDNEIVAGQANINQFQSTPPMQGATEL